MKVQRLRSQVSLRLINRLIGGWLMLLMLCLAALLLAYSNGANDNFKGFATIWGSGEADYDTALRLATITTVVGAIAALYIANGLVANFSGRGLVPAELAGTPRFIFAVALGAGLTVLLATRLGFPISTPRDYRWARWRRACGTRSRCKPRETWGYIPGAVASQPGVVGNPGRIALLACGAILTGKLRLLLWDLRLRRTTGPQCRSSNRCGIVNCRSSRRHD